MAPAELAFYSLLARRQCQRQGWLRRTDADLDAAFLAEYRQMVGEFSGELERSEAALAGGLST